MLLYEFNLKHSGQNPAGFQAGKEVMGFGIF